MRPGLGAVTYSHDLFVCHASEDKAAFVDDLVRALQERGMRVWYDAAQISLGDDFRKRMEQGLLGSRFGLVVVSPSFLDASKFWPAQELSALFNFEAVSGEKRVLPVLYEVDWRTLSSRLPFLATRRAADAAKGLDAVVSQVVAALSATPAPTARTGSRLYGVPLPSQSFVGRVDELTRLAQELEAGDVRVCASVEGLPGVGKTELVLNLAHQLAAAGRFPGGIFWFSAESPDLELAWASDEIAGALGVTDGTAAERARAVLNTLSRKTERVLIILDNVEHWSKTDQPKPLPSGTHVAVLATTRQRGLGGTRFRPFALGFLAPAEARTLLASTAGGDATQRPGFQALLDHLDGHALALELAGAYLREYPDVTPADYLRMLEEGRDPEAKVADQARYEHTVHEAFQLLWTRFDPRMRKLWQTAALFAPTNVSPALADACGVDGDARRDLRRFHLIELDAQGSFRMHRLTSRFGQSAGDASSQKEAASAFLDGVELRAEKIDLAAGFRIYAPDRAHFDTAITAIERVRPAQFSRLVDRIGTALNSLGEFRRAHELLELALASDLKNLGEHHPSVAARHSNLALVLKNLGVLPRARELLELALASHLKNLGDDHPNVAISRSNLALVLHDLGVLPRARELLELALASDLKNLGEHHPSVASSRSNLASVLQDLGELPRARELLELALAAGLQNLGEHHPSVATRRSNLALLLKDIGELPRARELLELALASDLKNLGEHHPTVAIRRSNLALVLKNLGELPRARELLELALASDLKNLGEHHPSVASSRSHLALVLKNLGELPHARELLELALASDLTNFGEHHPTVASHRSNLALVLQGLGDLPRAKELLEIALASGLQNLGEYHPTVATRRYNLATIEETMGDFDRASALLEAVLQAELKSLGPEHASLAMTRAKLANLLHRSGAVERARAEAQEAQRVVATQPPGSFFRTQVERLTSDLT